ncbi:MAG: ABC transporter permease [Candidatus Aminicenantes bacterium]|nr:ABC transporter permease [Candidatus Aminicenantes bacterium]
MSTLIKLAFRNIFRSKRRTLITFSAVSIGLALLVITISLMNGIDKQSISNIINCQTSHIKIFKKGYFDKKDELPMDITIKEPDRIRSLLKDIPEVVETESRILFGAGIIKGMDELPCLGVAIDPDLDPELFVIKESLIEGEWLAADDANMLVGESLAEDIGLSVGDLVTVRVITSTDKDDFSWNALDFEIKGIFDTDNPTVDSGRILIPLKQAGEGLSMESEVTEIVVRLNSDDDGVVFAARKKISEALKSQDQDLEVYTWKDLAGTFLAISKMKTRSSSMIIFIMLIIASMGIVNTMLMAVMERTREIGMLSALGMKKGEIMRLFILEGGFIGVFGSLLGCILGGLVSWYLEVYGWSMAAFGETMQKVSASVYPVEDVFYADLTLDVLITTLIFGTLISIIASFYPARKAARLNPTDALRHI